MKRLNKEEIKTIKQCILNEIESSSECEYIEFKRGNERRANQIEIYIQELKKLYKKI